MKTYGLRYLKSFWNIVDMVVIILAVVTLSFNIYRWVAELYTFYAAV